MFVPAHNLNEQDIIAVADYFDKHLVQQESESSEKTCRKKNFTRQRANQRAWHPAPLALRPMKLSKMVPREPWSSQLARWVCSSQLGAVLFCVVHEQGHVG